MSMSRSRFDAIYNGCSAIAKKVYGAVPISDAWSPKKICAELVRQGFNHDPKTVTGCLDTLRCAGLINEVNRAEFRREVIKDAPEAKAEPPKSASLTSTQAPAQAAKVQSEESPLDILGALAQRAHDLSEVAKNLSADIAAAAVDIQQHIESTEAGTEKLRQLQAILKSIG